MTLIDHSDDEPRLTHDDDEDEAVSEATRLSSRLVYEVIRREGEEELARPMRSLIWSGIAAGILISFSVLGEAIFRTYLPPDQSWTYLIENLGYSFGFLLVIKGGMQLFTENTITTVLPVMARPSIGIVGKVAKLWGIVLTANVVGAFCAAAIMYTNAIPGELHPAIELLSRHATGFAPGEAFMRAIPAGVLVAAIVWMLPGAEASRFAIILAFTWLIAAGDFTHIVAGSVEMAYLVIGPGLSFGDAVFGFFLPVFAGNVVGGTVIFAMLVYGQVRDEIRRGRD